MRPDALVSLAAGLLSFLSPCVLPLIPSWLSFIGGAGTRDLAGGTGPVRRRIVLRTVFFTLGFTTVFVALGILFSVSALAMGGLNRYLSLAAGIVIIALGLNTIFDFWKVLDIERRFHLADRPAGYGGAFVAGLAFSAGWSPCVGPMLASILLLAGTGGTTALAIAYLALYSLGLALPFVLMALLFSRLSGVFAWLKRHLGTIRIVSGVFLMLVGLSMTAGQFRMFNTALARAGYALSELAAGRPGTAHAAFAGLYGLVALAVAVAPVPGKLRRQAVSATRPAEQATQQPRHVRYRPVRIVLAAALAAIAALEAAGVLSTGALVGRWLTYQGV